jgi:alpha-ribazole phosphatase
MPLIFLRHSQPAAPDGLCYGRTDLDLAPGLNAVANRLAETLPHITQIATSPLSRCKKLATAIATRRSVPFIEDPNLIEMDFGDWENTRWNDIPRAELDTWADDFFHARPHGGESVAMLQNRTRNALANRDREPTLWVSHAGVYRALMAETNHVDPWNARIEFAQFETLPIP